MKYRKFIIRDYKAISGELTIDVSSKTLIPVIGINESGKTSILSGIFAFDDVNDSLNEGRHLEKVESLYKTTDRGEPSISAEIEITTEELKEIADEIEHDAENSEAKKGQLKKFVRALRDWEGCLRIKRDLITKKYILENAKLSPFDLISDRVVEEILGRTPYVLYFDDFRDTVDETVEITGEPGKTKGWLTIIEQLFKRTDAKYSVFELIDAEELHRESILADVRKVLNTTLAKEWEKFTLEEGSLLEVDIKYSVEEGRPTLKLLIKERIDGKDRYFGIRDRSKGFYWFFNFVMKLEFNPKVRSMDDTDTIYLLDEPGSYLHASAQTKLCDKLAKLSKNNVVIYCTHTHYLLDPDKIPLSYIKIAQKNKEGNVSLIPLPEYNDEKHEKRLAIQPIIDALQIKPFLVDFNHENVCVTEGIYDYYLFEMFKPSNAAIKFLPSVNANSIKFFVSVAIAWRLNYVALWDNDDEGRSERDKALDFFGEEEGKRFMLLPSPTPRRKWRLENLVEAADLKLIKTELNLPQNATFEKTIMMLYFSPLREEVLKKISNDTISNVQHVFDQLATKFNDS